MGVVRALAFTVIALMAAGCATDSESDGPTLPAESVPPEPDAASLQEFPDVIGVEAVRDGDAWTFSVTISSPYDSPARYADAWRITGPSGAVYGERILGHDHASEQPFTRSQSGIMIPADVAVVTVQGRDLENGWGGGTLDYTLPD